MINNFLINENIRLNREMYILKKKGLAKYLATKLKNYGNDERGAGVIELVLILVVLIGFVVIFKDKIKELLDTVYNKINSQASSLYTS